MSDVTKNTCGACGAAKAPYVVRENLNRQLNGPGGCFENAEVEVGEAYEVAFRKKGTSTWKKADVEYSVTEPAAPGNILVMYLVLKCGEMAVPEEE